LAFMANLVFRNHIFFHAKLINKSLKK
jgi:hypothetical protein